MQFVNIQVRDHIALVGLDRGKSNAINTQLIKALIRALDQIENEPSVGGMVLYGKDGFFSSGLDLIELYDYNEIEIREFWLLFLEFIQKFVAFKKPVVAAITGHCPAGGCALALCCDYRIMQKGDYIIGLNEIPVGIVLPESIFNLYRFWLGSGPAYRCLMEGKLMDPHEALKLGLVDAVVEQKTIRNTAEKQLRKFIQIDANTWQQSKLNIRHSLIHQLRVPDENVLKTILDQWWSPSARSILKTIINNLKIEKEEFRTGK